MGCTLRIQIPLCWTRELRPAITRGTAQLQHTKDLHGSGEIFILDTRGTYCSHPWYIQVIKNPFIVPSPCTMVNYASLLGEYDALLASSFG